MKRWLNYEFWRIWMSMWKSGSWHVQALSSHLPKGTEEATKNLKDTRPSKQESKPGHAEFEDTQLTTLTEWRMMGEKLDTGRICTYPSCSQHWKGTWRKNVSRGLPASGRWSNYRCSWKLRGCGRTSRWATSCVTGSTLASWRKHDETQHRHLATAVVYEAWSWANLFKMHRFHPTGNSDKHSEITISNYITKQVNKVITKKINEHSNT
jgi:hypothetical protein